MSIDSKQVSACLDECRHHWTTELLPFWLDRCKDDGYGGFITHFDKDGNDAGTDEKSLISQTRTVYSMSAAHRAGKPIWTHMSHSWKVNYHTIRCMVECMKRLERLLD